MQARVLLALALFLALAAGDLHAQGLGLLGVGGSAASVPVATGPQAVHPYAFLRPSTGFVTGFNQAWLKDAYGSQWGPGFDEVEARRMLRATRELGGSVLRMWLWEGADPGGVVWDGDPSKRVRPEVVATRPTGWSPVYVANLERFLVLAAEEGVRVYLTFFDANLYGWVRGRQRDAWWNVLNDRYGAGEGFRRTVVGPLLQVVARHRAAVFGVDLCNELNALVKYHMFEGGWAGCQAFVRRWRRFIRQSLDVPVGVSFGHGMAVDDLLAYRENLPPHLVDFYDFHLYNDDGTIPSADAVARMAATCGCPVYLGEFGQASAAFDDALQARTTEAFVRAARAAGLAGALAWRLSDVRPGVNPEARFSFEAFGRWRPAAEAFRRASSAP